MTAEALTRTPTPDETTGGENELRHYTPDKAAELLGCSARYLREAFYYRLIPGTKIAGRLMFAPRHIRAISEMGEIEPVAHGQATPHAGRTRKTAARKPAKAAA